MASFNHLDIDVDEARRVVVLTHRPPLAIRPVTIEVPFSAWSHVASLLLQRLSFGTAAGVVPATVELPAQPIGTNGN